MFFSTTTVPYIRPISEENEIYRIFNPEERAYHAKSMVLYGDPSMPLALYQYKSGNITQNTQWCGSIVVEDDISVAAGVTLTIQPGTGIFFKDNAQLKVYGTLIAEGTESYPIVFSGASENPSAGDWAGIYFYDSSVDANCIMKYCVIEYANQGITCNSASPTIQNCQLSYCNKGIYLYNSSPTIESNVIYQNYYGIYGLTSSSPTITNNQIYNNIPYGAYFITNCTPNLYENLFESNNYGVYVRDESDARFGPTSGQVDGANVVKSNAIHGIRAYDDSDPFLGSSDAYNNRIGGNWKIRHHSDSDSGKHSDTFGCYVGIN